MADPVRIALVSKLWGRPKLTRLMLEHHAKLRVSGVELALVAAVSARDPDPVGSVEGWQFIEAPNDDLREKGNAATEALKALEPDYVVNVGSDDFLSKVYLETVRDLAGEVDYAIPSELFVYCRDTTRTVRIYNQHGLGLGRVFSRRLMEAADWRLWSTLRAGETPDRALDRRMRVLGAEAATLEPGSGVVLATVGSSSTFWNYDRAKQGKCRETVDGVALIRDAFTNKLAKSLLSFSHAGTRIMSD